MVSVTIMCRNAFMRVKFALTASTKVYKQAAPRSPLKGIQRPSHISSISLSKSSIPLQLPSIHRPPNQSNDLFYLPPSIDAQVNFGHMQLGNGRCR